MKKRPGKKKTRKKPAPAKSLFKTDKGWDAEREARRATRDANEWQEILGRDAKAELDARCERGETGGGMLSPAAALYWHSLIAERLHPCPTHLLRAVARQTGDGAAVLQEVVADRNDREQERARLEHVLTAVEDRGSIFALLGDLWLVADDGRRAPLLEDRKGMRYVHVLLRAPEGLTPAELCGKVNLLPPGAQTHVERGEETPTPGTDADAIAIDHNDAKENRAGFAGVSAEEYRRGVEELKRQLRAAIMEHDDNQARIIRKALREIGEGDPKRRRLPPDKHREKMRDSVRRAIGRALTEIKRHHPTVAAYLRAHLQTQSGRWRYTGKRFTT